MSSLAQISRVKHAFDRNQLVTIINALVFSKLLYCSKKLLYCSSVWSNTSSKKYLQTAVVTELCCACIISQELGNLIIKHRNWKNYVGFPNRRRHQVFKCMTGQEPRFIFSEASQRSGILNPWIWLANDARSSGPDFPIRTPRMDRSNPRENLKWNHFTPA